MATGRTHHGNSNNPDRKDIDFRSSCSEKGNNGKCPFETDRIDGYSWLTLFIAVGFIFLVLYFLRTEVYDYQNQKTYEVYQVVEECNAVERIKKPFVLASMSRTQRLSEGIYLIKNRNEFIYENEDEEISVEIKAEDIEKLQYCGTITRYEYLHKDWKSILNSK